MILTVQIVRFIKKGVMPVSIILRVCRVWGLKYVFRKTTGLSGLRKWKQINKAQVPIERTVAIAPPSMPIPSTEIK